jgi:protein-S-isoprenylcysteine O-methyltransferase Ste14
MMKKKNGEHPSGDIGQVILLVVFIIVWVGDSFIYHKSTFLSVYVPLFVRLALFMIVETCAISLIRAGHVVVHDVEAPPHIITSGAFKLVRHPLYLGCILFYAGLVLSTLSLLSMIALGGIFIFYNYIASYEEEFLEEQFHEEYSTYREKTPKWIPRIEQSRHDLSFLS